MTKKFGGFTAVNNVSLEVYQSELFCLLGGSGCGKTTLLRMLAGFETPTSGRIVIDDLDIASIPPYERPVNMMFQSYALFPHMSVETNIAFGLRQDRVASAEIKRRVAEMLDLVKLGGYGHRKPHQLSGGQRQRVALARALIKQPKLLLLDEPLGALDRKLRENTQFELIKIQEDLGITFMVVTHDQEEAMTLSTRIGVMDAGEIVQTGTPGEIYEHPKSRFIAELRRLGQPLRRPHHRGQARPRAHRVRGGRLHSSTSTTVSAVTPRGARVSVAVRPEKITISRADKPASEENAAPAAASTTSPTWATSRSTASAWRAARS